MSENALEYCARGRELVGLCIKRGLGDPSDDTVAGDLHSGGVPVSLMLVNMCLSHVQVCPRKISGFAGRCGCGCIFGRGGNAGGVFTGGTQKSLVLPLCSMTWLVDEVYHVVCPDS